MSLHRSGSRSVGAGPRARAVRLGLVAVALLLASGAAYAVGDTDLWTIFFMALIVAFLVMRPLLEWAGFVFIARLQAARAFGTAAAATVAGPLLGLAVYRAAFGLTQAMRKSGWGVSHDHGIACAAHFAYVVVAECAVVWLLNRDSRDPRGLLARAVVVIVGTYLLAAGAAYLLMLSV